MKEQYEGKEYRGMVLRIERSSVHDGDGYRTVVFLKGCPLRCEWCSTPESQSFDIEQTKNNVYGTEMTVEDVMREVRKDTLFYFHSGGGMTLSGGELLAQPDFSRFLLRQARREGINTAIETTLTGPWKKAEAVLAHVNTAFVDLKFSDQKLHQKYCHVKNDTIKKNLLKTNESKERFRLVIRIPVIPGVNDAEAELDAMGTFCAQLQKLAYVELLPYHKLGTATYEKLGRPYLLADVKTPSPAHMERCRAIIARHVSQVK